MKEKAHESSAGHEGSDDLRNDAKPKLMVQIREKIHLKGYSYSTEKNYIKWIREYIFFHQKTHPLKLNEQNVRAFLNYLVTKRYVAPSTQNQALCAILFLYRQVLDMQNFYVEQVEWSKKTSRLPVVLSFEEVRKLLDVLQGKAKLPLKLMYGTGMRISECIRLRIMDIDTEYKQITIKDGKGKKDRTTVLPLSLLDGVEKQIQIVRKIHEMDVKKGFGAVSIPHALAKKYPNASTDFRGSVNLTLSKLINSNTDNLDDYDTTRNRRITKKSPGAVKVGAIPSWQRWRICAYAQGIHRSGTGGRDGHPPGP